MAKWLFAYIITLMIFPRIKPYLKDIIDRNLHDVYDGEYYSNLNIKLKENTEEEILQAAKEIALI